MWILLPLTPPVFIAHTFLSVHLGLSSCHRLSGDKTIYYCVLRQHLNGVILVGFWGSWQYAVSHILQVSQAWVAEPASRHQADGEEPAPRALFWLALCLLTPILMHVFRNLSNLTYKLSSSLFLTLCSLCGPCGLDHFVLPTLLFLEKLWVGTQLDGQHCKSKTLFPKLKLGWRIRLKKFNR